MEDTKTMTLRETIDVDGQTYTTITLREPTAGQIEEAKKSGQSETVAIRLIALSAGVPESVVRKMKARDYAAAANFVTSFFA